MSGLSASRLTKRVVPPGSRIRVLVVDDSVVIRRLVTHALEEDRQVEVAGAAPNGIIALQRIPQVNPDVITLDIEMPDMDGLETLRRIRQQYPKLPVIMFSTLTERGAGATLDALSLGANDYVTKAANAGSLDRSLATLRAELLPKIKQFFQMDPASAAQTVDRPVPAPAAVSPEAAPALWKPACPPAVVAVGVSTGGPNTLAQIIPTFPKNFPLPVLIVQHMPALFTRLLADRLNAHSHLRVEEASEGALVEPGKVLIARGDYHMRVSQKTAGKVVTLDQEPPENSCRPAVDVLFRSVAEVYGGAAIGVVLTGMGQDGLRGVEAMRGKGAYIIAQDEASSVVWGMPGAVVKSGLADSVLDVGQVVPRILGQI